MKRATNVAGGSRTLETVADAFENAKASKRRAPAWWYPRRLFEAGRRLWWRADTAPSPPEHPDPRHDLDVEDLETMDELVAMFDRELQSVARAWREQGIDTFGIVSGSTPPVLQVVWWINKLDSRARFDEVMQQLGREWTVEALVLKDRFRPLFADWRGVLHKAEGRLSGEATD